MFHEDKQLRTAIDTLVADNGFRYTTKNALGWSQAGRKKTLAYVDGWLQRVDCIFPSLVGLKTSPFTPLQKAAHPFIVDNIWTAELGGTAYLKLLDSLVEELGKTNPNRKASAAVTVNKIRELYARRLS
jgi:hypothetical protein